MKAPGSNDLLGLFHGNHCDEQRIKGIDRHTALF